jgi:Flp pilus assembly protein TadB
MLTLVAGKKKKKKTKKKKNKKEKRKKKKEKRKKKKKKKEKNKRHLAIGFAAGFRWCMLCLVCLFILLLSSLWLMIHISCFIPNFTYFGFCRLCLKVMFMYWVTTGTTVMIPIFG